MERCFVPRKARNAALPPKPQRTEPPVKRRPRDGTTDARRTRSMTKGTQKERSKFWRAWSARAQQELGALLAETIG